MTFHIVFQRKVVKTIFNGVRGDKFFLFFWARNWIYINIYIYIYFFFFFEKLDIRRLQLGAGAPLRAGQGFK